MKYEVAPASFAVNGLYKGEFGLYHPQHGFLCNVHGYAYAFDTYTEAQKALNVATSLRSVQS